MILPLQPFAVISVALLVFGAILTSLMANNDTKRVRVVSWAFITIAVLLFVVPSGIADSRRMMFPADLRTWIAWFSGTIVLIGPPTLAIAPTIRALRARHLSPTWQWVSATVVSWLVLVASSWIAFVVSVLVSGDGP